MSERRVVLIVDGSAEVLNSLKSVLEANNYGISRAKTVGEGIKRIADESPDVVLLDSVLPDGDGKALIKQVREWSDTPIIVLSADQRESEKIAAFDLGADDYIDKPFGVGELLARIRAAIRHRSQRKSAGIPILRVSDLEVDAERHQATRSGAKLKLTPREFNLLSLLAKHAGRVLTHKQILTALWGPGHSEDTHYLRVYINQLRRKVEDCPDEPRYILTEPGIGYRMAAG